MKNGRKLLALLLAGLFILGLGGSALAAEAPADGLLAPGMDEAAVLTWGDAALLIGSLMKDSGVTYPAEASQEPGGPSGEIFGAAADGAEALAALQAAGYADGEAPDGTVSGPAFDALLADVLHVDSLEGIGEYAPCEAEEITLGQARDIILSVVLVARNGAALTGDTNKFLCIEDGSTWAPDAVSGSLHVAGLIGYGTIAGIRAYGERSYDLESRTYNGLTIYYDPYAGSANIVMPQDTSSFEMCYVEGGARLYPDYPASLLDIVSAGAYAAADVTGETIELTEEDGYTAAVYVNDGTVNVTDTDITAFTAFEDPAVTVNLRTLGPGDPVYAATEGAVMNLDNVTISSLNGRGAVALAGAELNIRNCTITNREGSGSHGVCVLYGSVIDVKDSTIDSNTSALSSDFGGGLILADNVKAYAQSRGGGVLADGMSFAYVKNSELKTAADAAATTAGCGYLDIDSCELEGNDKAVLYSYVFGMLASEPSYFSVSNSSMTGNSHGIYIQGNTVDMYLKNDTLEFDNDGDGVPAAAPSGEPDAQPENGPAYLIYAENPTVPAPFYTRANIYLEDMEAQGDIWFDANTDTPCVKGYTDCYLNVYVGENASWTGSVVTTGHDGLVHLFQWDAAAGDYVEVPYELDAPLTITAG